jgi:DNA transformation protein
MAARSELLEYVVDQLSPLGDARGRAMFGGHGVYLDGVIVGIVAFDTLYLKVDDQTRIDFAAAGSSPFRYDTRSGVNTMPGYWECPADVLEDADRLRDWTLKARAAARRSQTQARRSSRARRGRLA